MSKQLKLDDGRIATRAPFFHGICGWHFIKLFMKNPLAENYLSQTFINGWTKEQYEITVRRVSGKTPSELNVELKEEIKRLSQFFDNAERCKQCFTRYEADQQKLEQIKREAEHE